MIRAAGIMFLSKNGNVLFLHRSSSARDFPAYWCFPGGVREGEETAEETALRETKEEIGTIPEGALVLHTRSAPPGAVGLGAPPVGIPVDGGAPTVIPLPNGAEVAQLADPVAQVDFTTFLKRVDEEFAPTLNDEHDGFAWAPVTAAPEPIHPGCAIALARLNMDELGVARAIAEGRLCSPQVYENVTLWAIRITGTGVSFRPQAKEFVHRDPAIYLNPDALARCNGLPVIFKHPKKSLLDSDEFSDRVVGTIFLPYVAGDEVWGIAKIYDDEANRLLREEDLSTSPGVNFKDFSVNAKLTLEDGKKVLIEGKPSLLDHVAICELGVWDKGGEPNGIRSESREDSAMTAEEEKAKKDADERAKADAKAKADADAGTAPDKTLSHVLDAVNGLSGKMDAFGKRMDAVEEQEKKRTDAAKADAAKKDDDDKKAEAERTAADKAKKDAADKDEKEKTEKAEADAAKAKSDADEKAKADAAVSPTVRAEIDRVAAMIPKSIGDADYHAVVDSQARADEVFSKFGQRAPRPLAGETAGTYERRCVRELKKFSPTWEKVDVTTAFADDASFQVVRDIVFREASATAMNPANVPEGTLRPVTRDSGGGHKITEFYGNPATWMNPMAGSVQMKATGRFRHENLGH